MKVTTDGCLFGAWVAEKFKGEPLRNVLDIGTGTGLLTLMLAQKINAQFDAVEVDAAAFEEASGNFKKSPWSARINCHQVAIQKFTPQGSFDLIVCNPPFFKQNQTGKDHAKNLAVHNLSLSMDDLITTANRLLSKEGKLVVMYPEWEMTQFRKLSSEMKLHTEQFLCIYNKEGGEIFRIIAVFSVLESQTTQSQLIIRDDDGYSSDFQKVIDEYYL